jgi:hypothetical protein
MTVAAIHQPQYLPWPPLLDKAARCDVFVHLDNVQFQKGGVQNRNQIKTAWGPRWLTVPVHGSRDSLIKDVRIAEPNFARDHARTIRESYARAPFLHLFEDGLRPILEKRFEFLVDLNLSIMSWMLEVLSIRCEQRLASELNITARKEELPIRICHALGAAVYLSGNGARAYQDAGQFAASGVQLVYQTARDTTYPQVHAGQGFVPDLSALDQILNTGPEARAILVGERQEGPYRNNKEAA